MVEPAILLPIAALLAIYALVSRWLMPRAVTAPMIFTAAGFGLSAAFGSILPMASQDAVLVGFAELTLVILLFSDAARVKLADLKRTGRLAARLLFVALPLSLLLGTLLARWVSPDQPWAVALLVAAILTPTDAALAQAFISSDAYPERLRTTIKIESGLNDGLVLPLVLSAAILAAVSAMEGQPDMAADLVHTVPLQLLLGPVIGVAIGWLGAKALDWCEARALAAESLSGPYFIAMALGAFWLAELVGGNGFLAAFLGGLAFGNTTECRRPFVHEFVESEGRLLTIATFIVFGALMVPLALAHASWQTLVLAIGFLTVVRIAPALLALLGTDLGWRDRFMLGWFGPRGLASILFVLLMLERYEVPGSREVLACTVLTVLISVFAHGASAAWLSRLYSGDAGGSRNSAQTGA